MSDSTCTPSRRHKTEISPAEAIRLKRLGLWYLRDNPEALASELKRVEREILTAGKALPQTPS